MNKVMASTLSGLIGALLMLGGVELVDDDVYYCEARAIVMSCDRLSSTMKTCYNSEVGNKRCYEGWNKVENDIIEITTFQSKQFLCSVKECIEI